MRVMILKRMVKPGSFSNGGVTYVLVKFLGLSQTILGISFYLLLMGQDRTAMRMTGRENPQKPLPAAMVLYFKLAQTSFEASETLFRSLKTAMTKARLLKHDLPFHGNSKRFKTVSVTVFLENEFEQQSSRRSYHSIRYDFPIKLK